MERIELDELAMMTKKDKSYFPLLLKNSKVIIDRVVSKYATNANMAFKDDYISEANMALFKCLDKYDSASGSFASFATYAIRQHILDFIRNRQSIITLGTIKLNEIKKVDEAMNTIEEQGIDMSRENIKKYSGISSEKTLSTVLWAKRVKDCISLDAPGSDNQDYSLLDSIPLECNVEDDVLNEEKERELKETVFSLPEDDRYLIISSYGLFGNEMLSSEEIAKRLNVSVQTVSYRKKTIKHKIRSMMEAWAS